MADEDLTQTQETDNSAGTDATQADTAQADTSTETDEKAGGTLLDGGDDKATTAPADWPDDWRAKLAGDDEKLSKRLDRFKSPKDILTAYRALEQKMSSGEVRSKLPDDATEEQIAAYRKENGVPEKAEGYLDALPDGLVVGEEDKALVSSFLETAHGKNVSPDVVNDMLSWYYGQQDEAAAAQTEADKKFAADAEDQLRAEWGGEYRANINSVKSFLSSAPEGLGDLLMGARLADGTPLGNHPDALRWLTSLANDINPAGFVSPGAGGSQAQSIEDEIAGIEKVMREDRKAYDKDEKMQARLRQLYDAQEKLGSRAA